MTLVANAFQFQFKPRRKWNGALVTACFLRHILEISDHELSQYRYGTQEVDGAMDFGADLTLRALGIVERSQKGTQWLIPKYDHYRGQGFRVINCECAACNLSSTAPLERGDEVYYSYGSETKRIMIGNVHFYVVFRPDETQNTGLRYLGAISAMCSGNRLSPENLLLRSECVFGTHFRRHELVFHSLPEISSRFPVQVRRPPESKENLLFRFDSTALYFFLSSIRFNDNPDRAWKGAYSWDHSIEISLW